MRKKARKQIQSIVEAGLDIINLFDEATPDQIISYLQGLKDKYSNRTIYFRCEPIGYDGGVAIDLYEYRSETDIEYENRIKKEKKAQDIKRKNKEKLKANRRKLYEELKKEFEK